MAPKKAEKAEDSRLSPNEVTKTVNFPRDGFLLRRVQAAAEKSRDSFSRKCLVLLEFALDTMDRQAIAPINEELAGSLTLDSFPPWLQTAAYEASKLTGLGIKGTLLDLDRRYMRDYLEVVRSEAETMTKFLSNNSAPPLDGSPSK